MKKKVTYDGIEISLPANDAAVILILKYLEKIVARLEEGLDLESGMFHLSLQVIFSPGTLPKHKITSQDKTPKVIENTAKLIKRSIEGDYDQVAGSVNVNFLVEDKLMIRKKT
ncbi:MAG: hypothetical protein MUO77_19055 [Anaerolineales bacterium]|nr:hypothetical protein [Anaerolineales bacterium]